MSSVVPKSLLWIPRATVSKLMRCYDYPHPRNPDRLIRGYDKAHAVRTAKMCAAVAHDLDHNEDRIRQYQVACLLHDLGRAGLDRKLFGRIWTWARMQDIPTRPAEWRERHPETAYGQETEAFWSRYKAELQSLGIPTDRWTKEQVEMRLGYARRFRRIVKRVQPVLAELELRWLPWMGKVPLYYYYPEKLDKDPAWVRELGEILVACEQLEACSNRMRGNDYYDRERESLAEAFAYLDTLREKGQLGGKVLSALRRLTATGLFDTILTAARKRELTRKEVRFLRSLRSEAPTCRL